MKKMGIVSMFSVAVCSTAVFATADVTVDFTKKTAELRHALHSSGLTPRINPRGLYNDDPAIKSMNFKYTRTHDWALVNSGQRIIDYQNIFPLFDLDAKNPNYYYFEPSDHIMKIARDVGLEIFYRLGTSIEHTGKTHFNAKVPKDFEKTAEIFAGIVRHYNKGWAKGYNWNIKYWEIWNEPDGLNNMWCEDNFEWTHENAERMRDKFIKFYVICLKRLKSEFPDIKVGGPALCNYLREFYFIPLLDACKKAGVQPDFLSWHAYTDNPDKIIDAAEDARKLCDSYGFKDTELIINEWHYILSWDGVHGRSSPAMSKLAYDGPTGLSSIDSAAFSMTVLQRLQTSKYDQAYFYGCGHTGSWGYMGAYGLYNKVYYSLKIMGDLMRTDKDICESSAIRKCLTPLATKSADGKKLHLVLTDYRGTEQVLKAVVKGAEKARKVKAYLLDYKTDLLPVDAEWRNGVLTLVKPEKSSAVFLVEFSL